MPGASDARQIEKQAAKRRTTKGERGTMEAPAPESDESHVIAENNAATGGHAGDPVPTRPNSRSAIADEKRAAAKATGAMSASRKLDVAPKIAAARADQGKGPAASDGMKKSRGARSADKSLDKGSVKAGTAGPDEPLRRRRSNAEIAESVTTIARRSPAPRSAQTDAATETGTALAPGRTGNLRQRAPAPGNVTGTTKPTAVAGKPSGAGRSTASTGGATPPKRSGRAGHSTNASRSKGADQGTSE